MPSETSFFDMALFKKNLTRWWPIWASYLTIWFFIMPIQVLILPDPQAGYHFDFESLIQNLCNFHIFFAAIYGVICAMAVFSYLYSPRSANFYGSLPVRREGIFLTQFVSGYLFTQLPNILLTLVTILFGACRGILNIEIVLAWLIIGGGEMLFFYSFAVFCAMFAGHILAGPVFYGIFNFISLAFMELLEALAGIFYTGFAGFGSGVTNAVAWLTPVEKLFGVGWNTRPSPGSGTFLFRMLESSFWVSIGGYALAGILLAGLSFLLFRSRKLESAGDVVAVPFMRPVFKYGVAVCAGMFLGYLTSGLLGIGSLLWAILVWAAIGCFAAQMILEKTFRVFSKWKSVLVMTVVLAGMLAVMAFDLTGYETRVPESADVESVTFHLFSGYPYDSSHEDVTVTDGETIAKVVALHKSIVRDYKSGEANSPVLHQTANFRVTYHTKHGTISRTYSFYYDESLLNVPDSTAYALESIYSDPELTRRTYGLDSLREYLDGGGRDCTVYYSYWGEDRDSPANLYPETAGQDSLNIQNYSNIVALLDAIDADIEAGGIRRRVTDVYDSHTSQSIRIEWGTWYYENSAGGVIYLDLNEQCDNTLRALQKLIPSEIASQNLTVPSEQGK